MRTILATISIVFYFACSSAPQIPNVGTSVNTNNLQVPVPVAEPARQIKSSEVSDEINKLKVRIEDLNNRVYVLSEQLDSIRSRFRSDNPPNMTELEAQEKKEKEINEFNSLTEEIKKQYAGAYDFLKTGKYARALIAFSNFIEKYPNTVLTDNAYYWLGESYYEQREYALAIGEYSNLLKKFPNGSKAPDALLKIAVSYEKLSQKADAESYYKELGMRFPKSRAAMLANNRLKELGK